MSELKPCMCGLTPSLLDCEGGQAMGFSRCYRAACDCGIEQITWDGSRSEAIERWNRRTPQPVTPAGGEVPVGGAIAFERAVEAVLRPHVSTAAERSRACNLFREWFDFANTHPPVADAAMARDAERYRWLRDECPEGFAITLVMRREADDWDEEIDWHIIGAHPEQIAALNQRGGGDER